jgi:hypothetical protein
MEDKTMTPEEYFEYTVLHSNIPEHIYKEWICEMMHNYYVQKSALLLAEIESLKKEVEMLNKITERGIVVDLNSIKDQPC